MTNFTIYSYVKRKKKIVKNCYNLKNLVWIGTFKKKKKIQTLGVLAVIYIIQYNLHNLRLYLLGCSYNKFLLIRKF